MIHFIQSKIISKYLTQIQLSGLCLFWEFAPNPLFLLVDLVDCLEVAIVASELVAVKSNLNIMNYIIMKLNFIIGVNSSQ